ncbi:MAG: oligopeptide transport system permease protein AppB [Pseudomonadota bacterium]|jgi:peptide/nickel transport system permease protein|nr:MAG: oligopeptide transport system permease protein AppB [Pseudomonadota bacterium]
MKKYILRRFLIALPVLFLISVISFTFIELAPGDAVGAMMMQSSGGGSLGNISKQQIEKLREMYGFNKPAHERYFLWMKNLSKGDFGFRFSDKKPVSKLLGERLPMTLELMGVSLILACVIGISLGVVSALKQNTMIDYILTVIAFSGVSVPVFFIAIVCIFIFSLNLDWFPTSGAWTPAVTFSIKDHIHHLILPSLVMAVVIMSDIMRYARASMLDVIREDYITTARAKGLRSLQVILGHAFRNALLPLITIIALKLPWILGGSSILETVFQWPGIGSLFIEAAVARDYYIVMALLMVYGGAVVFAGLIADIAYAVADPRIKYK